MIRNTKRDGVCQEGVYVLSASQKWPDANVEQQASDNEKNKIKIYYISCL